MLRRLTESRRKTPSASLERSSLDSQTLMLVRIAALVAVDAPPMSYLMNLEVAGDLGNEPDFDRRLAVAMNTVAGLALVREFDPSGRASRGNPWPYHREALERVLAG